MDWLVQKAYNKLLFSRSKNEASTYVRNKIEYCFQGLKLKCRLIHKACNELCLPSPDLKCRVDLCTKHKINYCFLGLKLNYWFLALKVVDVYTEHTINYWFLGLKVTVRSTYETYSKLFISRSKNERLTHKLLLYRPKNKRSTCTRIIQ